MKRPAYKDQFPAFMAEMEGRMKQGHREYGDVSFTTRPIGEVAGELKEEALDVAGWGFILWNRIDRLQKQIEALQRRLPRPSPWAERSAALRIAADQVWQHLFTEPLPERVKLRWRPWLRYREGQATVGGIHCGGEIDLSWADLRKHPQPLVVLVHEFAHARGFGQHDARFKRHVRRWLTALGLPGDADE